jgi:hypothetical protein
MLGLRLKPQSKNAILNSTHRGIAQYITFCAVIFNNKVRECNIYYQHDSWRKTNPSNPRTTANAPDNLGSCIVLQTSNCQQRQ